MKDEMQEDPMRANRDIVGSAGGREGTRRSRRHSRDPGKCSKRCELDLRTESTRVVKERPIGDRRRLALRVRWDSLCWPHQSKLPYALLHRHAR